MAVIEVNTWGYSAWICENCGALAEAPEDDYLARRARAQADMHTMTTNHRVKWAWPRRIVMEVQWRSSR